ncbi:type 2 periplasmic-binding domain-containing protein [Nitritalea halalkaliphila]|nr:ABC transporter substrate-binding protein [Nitritalea halalkaliphila]
MEQLLITGVPEHFNYPWKKLIVEQPFLKKYDVQLIWEDEPKGSGAMNRSLREGNTDLAIVLTESFIADRIAGNPARALGFYVESPLTWGVHTNPQFAAKSIADLKESQFLISRFGSGSHLMAFLLAEREGFGSSTLQFEVIGDLQGALRSAKSNTPKLFLWEKFTTSPYVQQGKFARIGEIPTPWPCFVCVARPEVVHTHRALLVELQALLWQEIEEMHQDRALHKKIAAMYQLDPEETLSWLSNTTWATNAYMGASSFTTTMEFLLRAGIITHSESVEHFVYPEFVRIV